MPPTQSEPQYGVNLNQSKSPSLSAISNQLTKSSLGSVDKSTVIVFDWDDTLLASSYLSSKGLRLDSAPNRVAELDAGLRELESSVISVLTLALQYGDVAIVTNAETGWVQLSAAKFIPAVVPLINQLAASNSIISARSTFESKYPDSPLKWKYYAFQSKLSGLFNDSKRVKNIISFGDSHVEREAVRACTRGFPNTRTKSVKFAERPSMEQLRRQIELVTNCFQYIHNHEGDLDLQLTVTINNNQNQQNNNSNNNANNAAQPVAPVNQQTVNPVATPAPVDSGSAASSEMYSKQNSPINNTMMEDTPISV
jgi:hypothetical protein